MKTATTLLNRRVLTEMGISFQMKPLEVLQLSAYNTSNQHLSIGRIGHALFFFNSVVSQNFVPEQNIFTTSPVSTIHGSNKGVISSSMNKFREIYTRTCTCTSIYSVSCCDVGMDLIDKRNFCLHGLYKNV